MSDMFGEEKLAQLRADIRQNMSAYRLAHTLGVERMAARLAALYCPEKEGMLRAAALLHDITKECPEDWQRRLMADHGIVLRADEAASPKIFHGITAAAVIPCRYPAFADSELISAVRWHTTGRADMTLTEALVYLADYIEEGRRFADCVLLREMFWGADPATMDGAARHAHLVSVLCRSLDLTLASLEAEGAPVCLDTLAAREDLKQKITLLKGT